jgi:hypothetical protein
MVLEDYFVVDFDCVGCFGFDFDCTDCCDFVRTDYFGYYDGNQTLGPKVGGQCTAGLVVEEHYYIDAGWIVDIGENRWEPHWHKPLEHVQGVGYYNLYSFLLSVKEDFQTLELSTTSKTKKQKKTKTKKKKKKGRRRTVTFC